jgi:hypothetical protein
MAGMVMEQHGIWTCDPKEITRDLNNAYTIQRYRGENMEIYVNLLHCIYLNLLSSAL